MIETGMSMTLLRRIASDHRRLVMAVAVLLAVDGLLYAVALYPWSRKVVQAEADAAAAESRLVQMRTAWETATRTGASSTRAEERLEQFYTEVLPPDFAGARAILSPYLDRLARDSALVLERQSSVSDRERGSRLSRLRTTMVLAGRYEDVRRFIHVLETAPEFILVEDVVLGQGDESDDRLVLTLGVSTYYRDAAPAAEGGSGA